MFKKVLVANRGEIAIRVFRALEEMGIASVAVYSELDRDALHVTRADEAYLIGGPTAAESYLKIDKIIEGASREGEKFFSDPRVYIERYLPDPRHVEVQVLADRHGNVIHLGERDCSVQRRHQKVIEEAPAPAVDEELRARIGKIGVDAAKAVDYVGA